MNILNYTDAETYLANKQVYFRKEIANSELQTIAQANMVHKVGKVEINDTSNRYHNCKAITIEINGIETTIYEYKTDLEIFAWLKTNLIPLNELVDNYLKREQLFCGTCNKFEVCKDLCKETDPCCKIYKAK